ncbi:DNA polymerase III subunit beta [Sphingosinicella ginsenosidimutans]
MGRRRRNGPISRRTDMADLGVQRKARPSVAAPEIGDEAIVSVAAVRDAVKAIGSVIGRRNTIPILLNARLIADGDSLALSFTDLDVYATARVPLSAPARLATSIPASLLASICREVPGGDLAMHLGEDGRLAISTGATRYAVATLPAEDFPDCPEMPADAVAFEMAGADLAVLLNAVRHAISTVETRYYLNGIYMHIVAGELTFVATDGHRLARIVTPCPAGAETLLPSIVPTKMVDLLRRLAERASEPVRLAFSQRWVRASFDGFEITSKLIDGTYPDYSRIIPSPDQAYRVTVDPSDLRGAVKRVAAIATQKLRAVKLACDKAGVTLSVNSPENGKASERVAGRVEGGAVEIWFNKDYLADILSGCIGEKVSLAFDHGTSPTLVSDPSRPELTQVQMPMRV